MLRVDENELWILSYYRASELAGALVMGRLAAQTDDDDLRVNLTEHCAEEANHAWLWTQTILEVGGTPRRVSETYQDRYCKAIGPPTTVLDVLALTQVFERRVVKHFRDHLGRPYTHPAVARTLQRMIADEAGPIGWVKERLDRWAIEPGGAAVVIVSLLPAAPCAGVTAPRRPRPASGSAGRPRPAGTAPPRPPALP